MSRDSAVPRKFTLLHLRRLEVVILATTLRTYIVFVSQREWLCPYDVAWHP